MGAPRLRTYREIAECLARIGGEELVLVGGQAVGFWVDRYFDVIPDEIESLRVPSKDLDVLAVHLERWLQSELEPSSDGGRMAYEGSARLPAGVMSGGGARARYGELGRVLSEDSSPATASR